MAPSEASSAAAPSRGGTSPTAAARSGRALHRAPLGPVTLEGARVRLEPLRTHHADGLAAAAQHAEIWPWMASDLRRPPALRRFLEQARAAEDAGAEYAFAVIDRRTDSACGSTRYLDVQAAHRGVEIGWTWYTPAVWRTAVNPEAKLLLLAHAFETWGAIRVTLKTDHMNVRSQGAIRKLGAAYEGTLRQHRIRADGTLRDTVVFSILDREWPGVREGLVRRLERARVEGGRGQAPPGASAAP